MASTTKRALIRGEVSIAEMVTITVKAIEGPQLPVQCKDNALTLAIPVVGSVTIAINGG
jgi:hypothetical protein